MNTNRIAQFLAAILVFAALSISGNAQLSQTTLSGYIYDQTGVGRAGIEVFVVKTLKDGQVVATVQNKATSTTGGAISLTIVRGSTIYLYSPDVPAWARNGRQGVPYAIPDSSTYSIENLASLASVYQQQGDTAPAGPNGRPVRVAGNTADGVKFYGQIGTAGVAGTPGWWTITGSGLSATQNNTTKTLTLGYTPTALELLTAFGSQTANTVLAGPTTGSAATPTWRGLVAADLPSHTHALSNLTQSGATSGQVASWNGSAWVPATVASGWGSITGTLSSQTDLQAALDLKANLISPSFTTPTLGVATATSINKVAITAPATSATLTIANGKTGTFSNTVTIAGTDGSTLNVGAGGTLGTAAYTASTAYEVPLTFSTGLTRSTNTITVNTSQNISTLSNLTSNGYVTTSGGTGALSISTASGILDSIGSTRGSILYRGASGWAILTPGPSGQALLSNGAGADLSYGSVSGSMAIGSTVTSGTAKSVLFINSGPVLAEDNTNFAWDDTDNRLGIGTNSPAVSLDIAQAAMGVRLSGIDLAGATPPNISFRQARNTIASPSGSSNTDILGRISFSGYSGTTTSYLEAARIEAISGGFGGSNQIADLVFYTGRTALTERMRITADGALTLTNISTGTVAITGDAARSAPLLSLASSGGGGGSANANKGLLVNITPGANEARYLTVQSSSTDVFFVSNLGNSYHLGALGINSTSAAAQLDVRPSASGTIGQIIRLASGQTANAMEIQNSTGTVLSSVDANGLWRDSGTAQTLTGAGAVNLTTYTTLLVTTGANALTLAAGNEGQQKFIRMKTDGGDGTLTVTNGQGFTTITFNDVGDFVFLFYRDSAWHILTNSGCTVA